MLTETTLCMGCMNDKTYDGPCRLCGYSDKDPYIPTYLAPKTILGGRYIVGRLLSYNGEGATYMGFDTSAGSKVILKEFMPDTLCTRRKNETEVSVNPANSPLYKTYMSEFEELHRTLMKLSGMAHIQAVLDVFSENNTCYAVFEFINGISLKTFLANSNGGLSWDQVKELFPPVFTALSMTHKAGIIHRGLSPQTIFVTDKMELMLTSFCITATRTTDTEIACEIFTGFAAPEQYSNDEINGTWTDVYGIAAVLYRVLTGIAPTDASSGAFDDMPEPMLVNRNVPANVSKVIMHGMARSPERRIRDIGDFVSRLFAPPKFVPGSNGSGASKPAVSSKTQRRLQKQQKERRKTLIVLVIMGIVLITFAIVFAMAMSGAFNPTVDDTSQASSGGTGTVSSRPAVVSQPAESSGGEGAESSALDGESGQNSDNTNNVTSIPEETVQVPDFTDRRFESTAARFEGIFTFVPEYEYSETHAAGLMYDQSVEEGTMAAKGEQIAVKVSKGPGAVPLPEYSGKSSEDYIAELTELNIKYLIEEVTSGDVRTGYIIKCGKSVGDLINVRDGETVTVYVSKGRD